MRISTLFGAPQINHYQSEMMGRICWALRLWKDFPLKKNVSLRRCEGFWRKKSIRIILNWSHSPARFRSCHWDSGNYLGIQLCKSTSRFVLYVVHWEFLLELGEHRWLTEFGEFSWAFLFQRNASSGEKEEMKETQKASPCPKEHIAFWVQSLPWFPLFKLVSALFSKGDLIGDALECLSKLVSSCCQRYVCTFAPRWSGCRFWSLSTSKRIHSLHQKVGDRSTRVLTQVVSKWHFGTLLSLKPVARIFVLNKSVSILTWTPCITDKDDVSEFLYVLSLCFSENIYPTIAPSSNNQRKLKKTTYHYDIGPIDCKAGHFVPRSWAWHLQRMRAHAGGLWSRSRHGRRCSRPADKKQ